MAGVAYYLHSLRLRLSIYHTNIRSLAKRGKLGTLNTFLGDFRPRSPDIIVLSDTLLDGTAKGTYPLTNYRPLRGATMKQS